MCTLKREEVICSCITEWLGDNVVKKKSNLEVIISSLKKSKQCEYKSGTQIIRDSMSPAKRAIYQAKIAGLI